MKLEPSSTISAAMKVPLVSLTDNECSFSLSSFEIIPYSITSLPNNTES